MDISGGGAQPPHRLGSTGDLYHTIRPIPDDSSRFPSVSVGFRTIYGGNVRPPDAQTAFGRPAEDLLVLPTGNFSNYMNHP